MRVLRVPRSGSMILTMFVALVATTLLPIVFMAALAASADDSPDPQCDRRSGDHEGQISHRKVKRSEGEVRTSI